MASSQTFFKYILDQFDNDNITSKKMMGEYILYLNDKIIGGVYDDRLLLKESKELIDFLGDNIQYQLPYEGGNQMIYIENVDDKGFLMQLVSKLQ